MNNIRSQAFLAFKVIVTDICNGGKVIHTSKQIAIDWNPVSPISIPHLNTVMQSHLLSGPKAGKLNFFFCYSVYMLVDMTRVLPPSFTTTTKIFLKACYSIVVAKTRKYPDVLEDLRMVSEKPPPKDIFQM